MKSREYIDKANIGKPKEISIQSITLAKVLDKYLPVNQSISFLSIDVEGHDLQVVKSNNWNKYRPELVLTEDHKYNIEQILESPITEFMRTIDYRIIAWLSPTIVYKDNRIS